MVERVKASAVGTINLGEVGRQYVWAVEMFGEIVIDKVYVNWR